MLDFNKNYERNIKVIDKHKKYITLFVKMGDQHLELYT